MFRGHNIIVCNGDYAIFGTRIDFTNKFVMSVDFADVKNNENMSKGNTYRMH